MKVIGFSCCVNYADILALTYPINQNFLDDYIISTSYEDVETQTFCSENKIKYVISDAYKKYNASFNKSAMLNECLKYIYNNNFYKDFWKVSLDADIAIDNIKFDKNRILNNDFIYGTMRKIIDDKNFFKEKIFTINSLRKAPSWQQNLPENFPHPNVGYFQMFKKEVFFNESFLTCSHCDTQFFYEHFSRDRSFTFLETEILSYHLGKIEQNWCGRRTKKLDTILGKDKWVIIRIIKRLKLGGF